MKVQFAPRPAPPVLEEKIMLGEEELGWIRTTDHASEGSKWHAGLYLKMGDITYGDYLIQGFGATKQDAIDNAIDKAILFADKVKIEAYSLMHEVHSQGATGGTAPKGLK